MAKRFGGKFSPDAGAAPQTAHAAPVVVDPVGGRANLLFVPAVVLVATTFFSGGIAMTLGLAGAGIWAFGAWLLRDGLRAEAAYAERKVAHRPAMPRKIFSAILIGVGTALAVLARQDGAGFTAPVLFGLITAGLHLAAFGIDPLKSKGMEGIDPHQQDRVARVVDEAERHLSAMSDAIKRANDRAAVAKLADFQLTARALIRTVEEDPRDLTAARKYLVVYLRGARDATAKFADIYARSQDAGAKADYLALLDDLTQNFAARTRKSLLEDRGDLNIEIDVLRERLSREGVRLD